MVSSTAVKTIKPRIIPESEHGILRSQLGANALSVIRILDSAGFSAELVGGCIRDLLADRTPKDFDVVTNATPNQVKKLFRRAFIIGRRFRLVQVEMGNEVIEVSTYRTPLAESGCGLPKKNLSHKKKSVADNHFGQSIEQDAFRRDFTLNSLYLRPSDMNIIDYTGGYEDIQAGIVRVIGSPVERYHNDPLRMLRAIRFAACLDFEIDEKSADPLAESDGLLRSISHARLMDEMPKLFLNNHAEATFELLFDHGLFQQIFPCYCVKKGVVLDEQALKWIFQLLRETDARKPNGETLSLIYFLAAILWLPFRQACEDMRSRHRRGRFDITRVAANIIELQSESTYISSKQAERIVSIWRMQKELESNSTPREVSSAKNFRPALRLLELRARTSEIHHKVTKRWVAIRDQQMNGSRSQRKGRKRRRRKPRWA